MKHTFKITLVLVALFFVSQIIGLAVTDKYINHMATDATGNVTWIQLPLDIERPQVEESSSYIYIFAAIIIGTLLVFVIIKTKAYRLWKLWFFLAVMICLTIALAAFMHEYAAFALAFILALLKIYKPNVYIHNITETLVYGGLAAILVPVISLAAMFMLLLLISLYDIYAVWHSKHMISMAKFQSDAKMFAGLMIPYRPRSAAAMAKPAKKHKEGQKAMRSAILGGGDIGFPLLFAGVVMKGLMLENTVFMGFLKAMIIPVFTGIALFILLMKSQEDKYYPAIPFLSIGCIAGYLAILLINII